MKKFSLQRVCVLALSALAALAAACTAAPVPSAGFQTGLPRIGDVQEQRHMDKAYWDKRARGLGGKLSSCGEENLLNLKGDRYRQENILIHEFNHAVHGHGLRTARPSGN